MGSTSIIKWLLFYATKFEMIFCYTATYNQKRLRKIVIIQHVTRVPEKREENQTEVIFKQIMAENFLKLVKDIKI